jgi:CO dehydrogenase maturation factor
MKIAIAGKGGVGKTTLAALLAQSYADAGRPVLAVDADPAPCLADALGVPRALRDGLQPIAEMRDLIEERTGAKPGTTGGFFTLNPRVDDIPEEFSVLHRGVRILEMGGVPAGGGGCICPESALLKALFTHLLFRDEEILILDLYAGVEHLGRATADFVDAMLVVAEPTRRSLATALQIRGLAADIGLKRLWLVGNKVSTPGQAGFLRAETPGIPLLGWLAEDPGVLAADLAAEPVYDRVAELRLAAQRLATELEQRLAEEPA